MPVVVRPLSDDDLPAVEALLAPTEERSLFLLTNARTHGITDRGGPFNGRWFGALEGGRLAGLISTTRIQSMLPACGPYARELVAAFARSGAVPTLVVGPADRVTPVLNEIPPARVSKVMHEQLLVMQWERYAPPARRVPTETAGASRAEDLARLLSVLSEEGGVPATLTENRVRAERFVRDGRARVAIADGRAVAMATEAATSPRFVHVGATATEPAYRRRGLAGSCVADVMESARAAGHASDGAVLFTGEENHGALALYRSMGFRDECPWSIAILKPND